MKLRWPLEWPQRLAWIGIALAGAITVASPWLKGWRLALSDAEQRLILVTTDADDGLGSLRSAILTADKSDQPRRILVMVPRVSLVAPLPPLVNPHGIVLDARHEGTELDASRVAGAALDIASPHTIVQGFRIVKAQAAIVVRASRVTLRGVTIEDSDTGILVGEHAEETTIDRSVFRRNRVGVQATGTGKTIIANNRFEDQRGSALWAVAPQTAAGLPELSIHDNRFTNDESGLVLVNRPATIEDNTFEGVHDTAVFASGGRALIRANHIRSGHGFGVMLDRAASSVVYRNEIAHNCSGGVMVREGRNTEVVSNDLYRNGFGIVMFEGPKISPNTVADNLVADHVGDGLVLIASSPLVRRNRLFKNAHAGVRLAALVRRDGEYRDADPLLEGNILRGNGRDEPFRDDYIADSDAIKTAATECPWRVAAVKTSAGGPQ
jgi:nitrous oxidase accessory protein NosD